LLHDNDGFLKCILFVDLFMELELEIDGKICDTSAAGECDTPKEDMARCARVSLGGDLQWSVLESID
jgi:hypothetical protein